MAIPPIVVKTAKAGWKWQWNQLMNQLAPADTHGNYIRPNTCQKQGISIPSLANLKNRKSSNLPILIIGRSCPWAHRTWLVYQLKGLKSSINLQIAKADEEEGRWVLKPNLLGCKNLLELYKKCKSPPNYRATVPLLIDPGESEYSEPKLIGNESSELIKILNNWPLTNSVIDLSPEDSQKEIGIWQQIIQTKVNNGVYRCGFARNQIAYNSACNELFNTLKDIEDKLKKRGPWLCGINLTMADVILFPTLIRWEVIYAPLFKCRKKPLSQFPNILDWRKRFFDQSLIEETCDSPAWENDYFGALFPLNPSNIIPSSQDLKDIVNLHLKHS